ncbi:MAG: hypothetical protein ACK2UU_11020, partial [Anaerolineae bacterium]
MCRQGRLVADAGKRDWDEPTAEYGAMFMEGLSVTGCKRSDRGQACGPLRVQHLRRIAPFAVMGYLKKHLSGDDKANLRWVGAPGPHRGLPAGAGTADR